MDPARAVPARARLRGVWGEGETFLGVCVSGCSPGGGSLGGGVRPGQWETSGLGGGLAEGAVVGTSRTAFLTCHLRLPRRVQQRLVSAGVQGDRHRSPRAPWRLPLTRVLTWGQGNASAFEALVHSWPLEAGGPQSRAFAALGCLLAS